MIFQILFLLVSNAMTSPIKELNLKPNDVATINTSIGYSTVIQLNSKPQNVVLGDQSTFRVEYINNSITVKPLRSGARSNLFIFTDNDRFNITLKSGPAGTVDYVVKLRRIFEDPKAIRTIHKSSINHGIKLTVEKLTTSPTDSFFDFQIFNGTKTQKTLRPENLRVISNGEPLIVRSLFLSSIILSPLGEVSGSISLLSIKAASIAIWVGFEKESPLKFTFNLRPLKSVEVAHAF